jgi:hypothetical protein
MRRKALANQKEERAIQVMLAGGDKWRTVSLAVNKHAVQVAGTGPGPAKGEGRPTGGSSRTP